MYYVVRKHRVHVCVVDSKMQIINIIVFKNNNKSHSLESQALKLKKRFERQEKKLKATTCLFR